MTPRTTIHRERGALLIEAIITLMVLTVGILGLLFAFQANFRSTNDTDLRDRAQLAFEGATETLHTANFWSLYATYQGAALPAPGLIDDAGNPAVVRVSFDINETALPPEYGPLLDLDGDGVLLSPDASATYRLLPARLTLVYMLSHGVEAAARFIVLTPTN